MPSRRDIISMDEQEIWKFIETQKTVQVCSLNENNTPHLVPMWFVIDNKNILLVSYSKSQKIVNLKRNPNIAVLFEDGTEYKELRGVSINCQARLIDIDDEVRNVEKKLIIRNHSEMSTEDIDAMTKKASGKKTAIVISPDRIVSWDHRKLEVSY